jgi:hypothetical protein
MIPAMYSDLQIEEIVVTDVIQKYFLGTEYLIVNGSCRVVMEDEDFIMAFNYKGKAFESEDKLLNHLKEMGAQKHQELLREKSKARTLKELVRHKKGNIDG